MIAHYYKDLIKSLSSPVTIYSWYPIFFVEILHVAIRNLAPGIPWDDRISHRQVNYYPQYSKPCWTKECL